MYAQTVKTSEKMIILRLYTIKRLKVFVLRFMRRIVSLELWMTIPKKVSKTPKHRDPKSTKDFMNSWSSSNEPKKEAYLKLRIATTIAPNSGALLSKNLLIAYTSCNFLAYVLIDLTQFLPAFHFLQIAIKTI